MKSKLQNILSILVHDATKFPHMPQKRILANGLRIQLTSSSTGITLFLSRDVLGPSLQEAKTVLDHFPYYTGKIIPIETSLDNRKALRLDIPVPSEVNLSLFP